MGNIIGSHRQTLIDENTDPNGPFMTYCELWLESKSGLSQFRVALLVPDGFELPEGFTLADTQHELSKKFYVSEWYDGIIEAKRAIDAAAKFYSDKDLKFLYFREIRKPR